MCAKPLPKNAESLLPIDVLRSKTSFLKLINNSKQQLHLPVLRECPSLCGLRWENVECIPMMYGIMGKSNVCYDWKFPKVRRLIFVGTFHLIGESNGWCVQYPGSSFLGSKQVQYFPFTVSRSRIRGFLKTEKFSPVFDEIRVHT